MPRDHKLYLKDMLEAIRKIERYSDKITLDNLVEDEMLQDAIIRNLGILGEAVKNIPEHVKSKNPEVEWKKIAGLRDIITHAYFGVDMDIIWDVVKNKIPIFKEKLLEILSESEDGKD